uniref:Uncharacterized protein n=1 Tax=Desertifilum tharense IPPAS B-1220 TaxID=1781255 RepID=A0ACD5GVL2_9CYAN
MQVPQQATPQGAASHSDCHRNSRSSHQHRRGGAVVREMELLQKHLPRTGKYENVEYKIEWSSYTSGLPITNKMVAGQIDIGLMGDFPAVINMLTFQKEVANADSLFIGTLAYSPTGAGNAVVVPKDSPVTSLADLRGKTVSVPFGSYRAWDVAQSIRNSQSQSRTRCQIN